MKEAALRDGGMNNSRRICNRTVRDSTGDIEEERMRKYLLQRERERKWKRYIFVAVSSISFRVRIWKMRRRAMFWRESGSCTCRSV